MVVCSVAVVNSEILLPMIIAYNHILRKSHNTGT